MKKLLLSVFLAVFFPTVAYAVYCGQVTVPGGGGTGGGAPGTPPACHFYVAASGGSDGNTGLTSVTPFATLEHAQSVMEGLLPATSKVVCLKAGTYARTAVLNLGSADSGETWEYDPASGVNTAILDGGGTVDLVNLSGVANLTWDGIKMQNMLGHAFYNGGGDNNTIENSDISNNHGSSVCGDGFPPMFCIGPGKNWQLLNNYVHNTISQGIADFAYNSGESIDGLLIQGNVVLSACQSVADCGGIYINMHSTGINGGHVTIKNNFVRDWGSSALTGTGGMRCIYLDDNTSNTTVQGNVCGPPTLGGINSGNENNSGDAIVNGGTNNVFTGNIFDIGSSGRIAVEGGGGNSGNAAPGMPSANVTSIINNLILYDFSGPYIDSWSGVQGFAYYQAGPASSYTFGGNGYVQFSSGGGVFTGGQVQNDTSATTITPANLKCNGYLYTLDPTSAVFSSPINFTPIIGGWGPPGFVIPTSNNHSCP